MFFSSLIRSNEPSVFKANLRITGAGAANPTNTLCRGVTVTRLSAVGKYRATFADNPGVFAGANFSFQATTPSDLRGYTVVFGDLSSATATADAYIDFWVYDSTFTLDDLEAGWKLNLEIAFKRTSA